MPDEIAVDSGRAGEIDSRNLPKMDLSGARVGIYTHASAGHPHRRLMQRAAQAGAQFTGCRIELLHLDDRTSDTRGLHGLWVSGINWHPLPSAIIEQLLRLPREGRPTLVSGTAGLGGGLLLTRRPLEPGTSARIRETEVHYSPRSVVARTSARQRACERAVADGGDHWPNPQGLMSKVRAVAVDEFGRPLAYEHQSNPEFVVTSIWPEFHSPCDVPHPLLLALSLSATATARQQRRQGDPESDRYRLDGYLLRSPGHTQLHPQ